MANIQIREELSPEAKILQMAADAQYDVADGRDTDKLCIPDLSALNRIQAPAPPPKVPKLFVAGHCIFNCAYLRLPQQQWRQPLLCPSTG